MERSIVALEGRYRVSYTPIAETVSVMGVSVKHHGGGEVEEEELWNGTPHRGDVKINSGHPFDGHMMTFEYILGSTEDLTIDEGADIVNITADNYVYSFTRN